MQLHSGSSISMKLAACFRLFPVCALLATTHAGVVISEFQASNQDTIRDEDGDRSDWIELRNDGSSPASLAGLSLTDNPANQRKWILPDVTLAPGSYLLVWASSKDRANPAAPLHTNFRLSAAGGYLALFTARGKPLTEYRDYPEQPDDRSWGSAYAVETLTALVPGADCRLTVPTAAIANWQLPAFDDSTWRAAKTGIGYDRTLTPTDFTPLIGEGGNVESLMFNLRPGCFIRLPFSLASTAGITSVTLRMRWEDGFAAWLNGTRLNPPDPAATNSPVNPLFNQTATAVRADTDAVIPQDIDITGQLSLLTTGQNLLAIHALNQSTSSSDLLIVPEIIVTREIRDGAPPTGYFITPTPGKPNTPPTVAGFTDAPDFSVKRGFQTTPFSVSLTTKTAGATIRYTTDSSPPTESSNRYAEPIMIAATTVLRAAAFRPGWAPSVAKTHTYVFPAQVAAQSASPSGFPSTWGNEYNYTNGTFTGPIVTADYGMDQAVATDPAYATSMVPALTESLPVISLAARNNDLFNFNTGIYCNGRISPTEIPASIEFFNPNDPTGTDKFQEDIGLRMHGGNAPIDHPKKPFRVYFRKKYGIDRLRFPLFPGSPVEEFDKLQLRPGGHDGWAVPFGSADNDLAPHATYLRDRFLRQTELDMGRLSHRGRYVHLYINGLYWGVYDLHEVISSEFFASHQGGAEEDWDVYEHSNTSNPLFDVVEGTSTAMDNALALVRPATRAADPVIYAAIQQIVPIDEFIDNLLVQMWGAQNDWMGPVFRGVPNVNLTDASRFFNKNWESGRRSRGPLPTAGLFWQTWDAEISMGNSLTQLVPVQRVSDFNHTLIGTPTTEIPRAAGTPGPPAELWYALRRYNNDFRRRVSDRIQKHFLGTGALSRDAMQARLLMLRNQLDLPIVAESARWGDVNSGDPVVVTMTRNSHWRPEVDWLRDTYIANRQQTLLSQFSAIGMWPNVPAPAFSSNGGFVPSGFPLTMTSPDGTGTIYYTVDGSDPALAGAGTASVSLLAGAPVRFKVPTANYPGNSWKNLPEPADIATWTAGTAALGFTNGDFSPHITTTVPGMLGVNPSLYARLPFTLTPELKSSITRLTLNLKYDDGAFVFLNGSTPLFRLNAPSTSPAFNAVATAARPDTDAISPQSLDLTNQIATLSTDSPNLLALQGLNDSAGNPEFLLAAELIAEIRTPEQPTTDAVAYAAPVPLASTGMVRARTLRNGTWSPLTEAYFVVGQPASAANLAISEFSYNPTVSATEAAAGFSSSQFEFIELLNTSQDQVELSGCHFSDGIDFDFSSHSALQSLAPGQRLVIVSNPAAFAARHPRLTPAGQFQNATGLNNTRERLALTAADGSTIFDFTYSDAPPWPKAADGQGYSLVLIRPESLPDPSVPSNWRASGSINGAPGASDADSFAAWAERNGMPSDPQADSDGNGLAALTEYALAVTPSPTTTTGITSARFEMVTADGQTDTYLVVRFRRNRTADDVIIAPQYSTDASTWLPLTDEVGGRPVFPDGTEEAAFRTPLPVSALDRARVRIAVTPRN
jgi:hypothetical protein